MRSDELDTLLQDAAKRAARYLEELRFAQCRPRRAQSRVWPRSTSPCRNGSDPRAVLAELDAAVSPATMATVDRASSASSSAALPVTLAASVLATAWDQNSARHDVTPGTAAVEDVALRWVLDALGPRVARPAVSSPARRSRTSPRSPRHVTPSSPARMGRGGAGAVRGAGDDGGRRRRGARQPLQGAGDARARPRARRRRARGRAGPDAPAPCPACRRAPSSACRPAT